MPAAELTLPPLPQQAERLICLGVHRIAGVASDTLRDTAHRTAGPGLLAVHPDLVPASMLAPLLMRDGKAGFVVSDMTDVDEFVPTAQIDLPASPVYVLVDPDRGDAMADWSPDEALPAITGAGRTPLLLTEGLHWVVQQPAVLTRNHCFMTIGSRRRKPDGALDARTPALWISNGTGPDGSHRRHAPKVGWCWAGNRHTWLGFASAAERRATAGR